MNKNNKHILNVQVYVFKVTLGSSMWDELTAKRLEAQRPVRTLFQWSGKEARNA